ncbi:50S ribosomal protein L1 [Candidatus Palibaumannia cicadellinicola]|uniref:Large ribosomal subunit protein uL1 n=1 Tax=Baumannia cicadellinicola subsp. Homalodisca coagulata TaxID=374463 RepID=RL1_BAUCH|nr:50S ribosomal protein L1 [Candidatus Baumannia cicadellinicola]Q1LSY0.1 RecName: Full=Large ribosomal subunit protein uL1; AltName: Full=50S ribosomal protein L1 [Baumannia cicadellinicola str. Hc (Homalodisca coagulata)]ABF13826.1 50S ribosomal protein L1 [Baumannia cicadellinicola str. Hc (Homalodisca coagulata)]MBS0032874.1 50S ribosomal protein L1 [Candidatus Baumannia cicadellinicola]MCJ7462028.1 50S ribosomal protein L1 [Candidatus Baumannia cicadellinicola]
MGKTTKRMRMISNQIDRTKQYNIHEAIPLLKDHATVKFIESLDVAVKLGINARKSSQNIHSATILPHGIGRSIKVAVFAQGINVSIAETAGADLVGMDNLAAQITKGNINFDVVIASPDTMHLVSTLGQILGPKGMMPNTKTGTITQNIALAIKEIKSGQIRYHNDKNGIIHTTIGKINFESYQLIENLEALLRALKKDKPLQTKGIYFKKICLSTTMGPSLTIDQCSLSTLVK